jgi:hypothetical protein
MDPASQIVVGEGDRPQRINSAGEARDVLAGLISQAQRRIDLLTPAVDAATFQRPAVADALARFVTINPRNSARFLISEAHSLTAEATQLAELCRRFPSFLSARWVDPRDQAIEEMFCVIDGTAYLAQPRLELPSYVAVGLAPARARELTRRFDSLWQRAAAVPGLSTAGL